MECYPRIEVWSTERQTWVGPWDGIKEYTTDLRLSVFWDTQCAAKIPLPPKSGVIDDDVYFAWTAEGWAKIGKYTYDALVKHLGACNVQLNELCGEPVYQDWAQVAIYVPDYE